MLEFWVAFAKNFEPKPMQIKQQHPRVKSWETLLDMGVVQTTPAPHTGDCVESKDAR